MNVGETWAYREPPNYIGKATIPAEVLQLGPPKTNKVRVRFLDGEYVGLAMWVPRQRLKVLWQDADAWLQDEVRFERVRAASADALHTVEFSAAEIALYAYPQPNAVEVGYGASEGASVRINDLSAVARDLGLDADRLLHEPLAFVDRHGAYVAAWPTVLQLAQRMAERQPDLVLAAVDKEERDLRDKAARGHATGSYWEDQASAEFYANHLREQELVFALVRQWCGETATARYDEINDLRAEVLRLRGLVLDVVSHMEQAGDTRAAKRLRRQLDETVLKGVA